MIDSVFPGERKSTIQSESNWARLLSFSHSTPQTIHTQVQRCFGQAVRMITEWEPPMEWSNCSPVSNEETNVKLASTTFGEGSEGTPPPTILLRATREISGDAEKCHALDTYRTLRHLGWEQYNQGGQSPGTTIPHNRDYLAISKPAQATIANFKFRFK